MKNSVFKALADPTRREILRLLRVGPRHSGEIAERNGQQISYELNTTVLDDVIAYMLDWKRPGHPASSAKHTGGKRA
jgi:DNA-binding transcriptional ArsR family regulator